MDIAIREAHLDDTAALIELRKQLDDVHAAARPDLFTSGALYGEAEIASYLAAEKSHVVVAVAKETEEIAGYMILNTEQSPESPIFRTPRRFVYVNDLCVLKGMRGRGIGKKLMAYAVAYAKQKQAASLELNVAECNENAIRLYESMGLLTRNRRMELRLHEDGKPE